MNIIKKYFKEAAALENYNYRPIVNLLLVNSSSKKVEVLYNSNPDPFQLPKIGLRPPYYCNPRYGFYYPII